MAFMHAGLEASMSAHIRLIGWINRLIVLQIVCRCVPVSDTIL